MNVVVVGAQWGDEGKGKVVDVYGADADYIVRYQGGNNAGHTVIIGDQKIVLHLIPSGVLHEGKTCLIANGVVFDPLVFMEEIESLKKSPLFKKRNPEEVIKVSERAHVILPFHRKLDLLREKKAAGSKGHIGTTARGIGPAYEDKVVRRGIQVIDLYHPKLLREKLERVLEEKNFLFETYFKDTPFVLEEVYQEALKMGEVLKPYVSDVRRELLSALKAKKKVLFEGAQGTLLDLDHGTYPYVTSSNTVAGGIFPGCGIGNIPFQEVIGITKAYTTRVGAGPFPTEMKNEDLETADKIQKIGAEFGATTGRLRRVGWLDLVALKFAVETNGLTGIAFMKSDVLQDFETVSLCTGYRIDGKDVDTIPACVEDLEKAEPVYEKLSGWPAFANQKISHFDQLPKELQTYIRRIEDFIGIPVVLMSTGPERESTVLLRNPFS